jgi:type I restriction enzyme S subunit
MSELLLDQALEVLIDHRGKTPRKLGAEFTASGVPVVSAVNIARGRLQLSPQQRRVSLEVYEQWMPIKLHKGDVLLTSEAPLGEVALVLDDEPLVLGQRLFGLRGRRGVLDSLYLFYVLQYEPVHDQLLARSTGTTVSGIRQAELVKIKIPDPGYKQQLAIAEMLGELDDKIAINIRIANLCLSLADLLFEGMRTNSGSWGHMSFGEFAKIFGGGTPSTKKASYWDGDILWATPTDVTRLNHPYLFDTARRITEEGLKECASGLYPAGSILMTSRATIGAFAVAQKPTAVNQGFIVVAPRREEHRWYLFHEMTSRVDDVIAKANGSTFLEISRGNFKAMTLPVPSERELRRLNVQLDPLHRRARAAALESQVLAELRGTLLPALISGEIRVRDAERVVEGVT